MDERLKLAEAYYMVASDLQRQAECILNMAKNLDRMADRMCEDNIRERSGCRRSHPHENMSAECERLTEIARNAHSAEGDDRG